ncbi:MAG: MerR family transcriptional regulator [Oceanospirillaceae bacterium]|nr:MerR family transcriptional regulator [Oceanospirillaceae bacterium]
MSADESQGPASLFPIRELSARTQINTVTLRAWERRYGLLKPQRTPKGHRLYSDIDVAIIERILTLVARGVPIGKVKSLLEQDVAIDSQVIETSDWLEATAELKAAVTGFSSSKVEHLLHKSFSNYPAPICSEHLLKPLFSELSIIDDHGAAFGFAESELVRYALMRSNAKVAKKSLVSSVLLISGHHTPMWRLALMALELTDVKFSVHLLTHSFGVAAAIELAKRFKHTYTVFYQDGLWKDADKDLVAKLSLHEDRLFLCGTAPVLANIYIEGRVFKNSNGCITELIKRQIH